MILYDSHISGSLEVDDDLIVTGIFYATEKHFYIDHPSKKGKKLIYGTLEGPENAVYLRGQLINKNIIELPDYWSQLVDLNNLSIVLTPIGHNQILYVDNVKDNKIFIKKSWLTPFNIINCYYFVVGERKDIPKLKIEIEPMKGIKV